MCGIICIINLLKNQSNLSQKLKKILENRGPDKQSNFICEKSLIEFHGFVLWQQGFSPSAQPLVSENYVLLLNGDIFNSNKSNKLSDTAWLSSELEKCQSDESLLELLTKIHGPFSVIIYNRKTMSLYFGRDSLGRNSLLIERDNVNNQLKILSTSCCTSDSKCVELPPVGIFKINFLETTSEIKIQEMHLYLWNDCNENYKETIENIFGSTLIIKNPLSLIRLEPLVVDYFNFYEIFEAMETNDDLFSNFLEDVKVYSCVEKLIELLKHSIKDRVVNTPKFCLDCIKKIDDDKCVHSKIGILFSGGLDCSILAKLCHEFCDSTESIDLINVSFESFGSKDKSNINWDTPDRITAIKSYEELKKVVPERKWNLIEVNVTRKELENELLSHIKDLIYPLNTVLDESLGASFWFSSRGVGRINEKEYRTTSRVILIGSGADELFGGYTRHRNAFSRTNGNIVEKIEAVEKELMFDWKRIAFRNLGRDDRVIGDNGKTARSPYIEENLVNFVTNLKPEQKCCFNLEHGVGDKLLLRLCGYKLGLQYSSKLKKRAIQFGSKIANKKQNANDISELLTKVLL